MTVRVTFDVYGVYTHGEKFGKTNPKQKASVRYEAEDVKGAVKKLTRETDGAFYTIRSVDNG